MKEIFLDATPVCFVVILSHGKRVIRQAMLGEDREFCLLLKESPQSPAARVTLAPKTKFLLELNRFEEPHQMYI